MKFFGENKSILYGVFALLTILLITSGLYVFAGQYITRFLGGLNPIESSFNNNDYDKTIEKAEKFAEKYPNDIASYISLASAYLQKGSVGFEEKKYSELARNILDRARKISPNFSEVERLYGYSYEITEEYEVATTHYKKAIELDATNALAYSQLGHAYDLQGKKDLASVNYTKALNIDSELDHALLNNGRLHFFFGNKDQAKSHLNKLISSTKNDRQSAEALQILGLIKIDERDFKGAERDFEKAIALDPSLSAAWASLAQVKFFQIGEHENDSEEFIEGIFDDISKALEIHPYQTSAHLVLADLMNLLGETGQAIAIYQDVISEIVDKDITLGQEERVLVRGLIQKQIDKINQQ